MRIGVIGTGDVGSALASGFADKGHDVMIGSRDPSQTRLTDWAAEDPAHRSVGGDREAVEFGEVVVIAVPGRALAPMLDAVGTDAFDGRIIIDVTNPIGEDDNGRTIDIFGDEDSGAEYLQRELPGASVVKAFNEVLSPAMTHPEQSPVDEMHIAGNDPEAKKQVALLAEEFGWTVRDVGKLSNARTLEHAVISRYG